MKKLVSIISLIVLCTFSVPMHSQVEVSEANIWETSVFKEPIKSQKSQEVDTKLEAIQHKETIVAFIIADAYIQYDAQILQDETLAMSKPAMVKNASVEEDYFKITYRQEGLSIEYLNGNTATAEGILAHPNNDFFESTITAARVIESLALYSDDPYRGVGYIVQPNIKLALGWNTQKPMNQLKSLL